MTKTIFAIALAAVATVGAANASTQLVDNAQNLLDQYGFEVDAGELSTAAVVELKFIDGVSNDSVAETKARIAAALK